MSIRKFARPYRAIVAFILILTLATPMLLPSSISNAATPPKVMRPASLAPPTAIGTLSAPVPSPTACAYILDSFLYPNGPITRTNWTGDKSYFSTQGQLLKSAGDREMFWVTAFGSDQRASIYISQNFQSGDEFSLYLKVLNSTVNNGVIEVKYLYGNEVKVFVYDENT